MVEMNRLQEFGEGSEWNQESLFSDLTSDQAEVFEQQLLEQLNAPGASDNQPLVESAEWTPYQEKELYNEHGVQIIEYTQPKEQAGEPVEETVTDYLKEGYFEEEEDGSLLRHPPRLDPEKLKEQGDDRFVGEPLEDLKHWHQQETPTSCAVACQDYIIDALTEQDPTEQELRELAEEMGWYREGEGTPGFAIGELAKYYGLQAEAEPGMSLEQVKNALEQGDKLIASVDTRLLYYPENEEFAFAEFLKQGCHAVQVTGLDMSNPDDIKVIINDPWMKEGGANVYSWDEFERCSEDVLFRIHP